MTTSVEDRISLEDRISRLEGAYEHLATKADVAELGADLKSEIRELRADLEHTGTKADIAELRADNDHFATKEDIAELRAEHTHLATKADVAELRAEIKEDMGKLQVSLIKWMVGLVLGGMIGISGLIVTVMRVMTQ